MNRTLLIYCMVMLACLLTILTQPLSAQTVKEIADDFAVDGSAHQLGDLLVGSKTPIGGAVWRASKKYNHQSMVLTRTDDMIVDGRVTLPKGQNVVANGVDLPVIGPEDVVVMEFETMLNKAAYTAIVVNSDWDKFWGKTSLFMAQYAQNGNVCLIYPGGRVDLTDNSRPWWLSKNQPILLRLVYDAKNNTVGFGMRGVSVNPSYSDSVLIAKDVKLDRDIRHELKTAGMFVNGQTAVMDNFRITIGPAGKDPLDFPKIKPVQKASTKATKIKPEITALADGKIDIAVPAQQQQTFEGFGASIMGGGNFLAITPQQHAQLAKLVWGDLKFRTMRLWFYTWHFRKNYGPGYADFKDRYLDNHVIQTAQAAGMNSLYFCGDNFPPQWTHKDEKGHAIIDQKYLQNYAQILADIVDKARKEDNIHIGYVGLQNEPGAHDPFRPEDFPPAVKYLRQELDRRHLKDVKIVAPEMADVGTSFFRAIELLQADKQAWDALDVISAHSYGNTSNPRLAKLIKETGKTLWMTESSNAPPDDSRAASASAGLCMNDLNHMASRWLWFIGYAQEGKLHDRNGARLVAFSRNPFKYEILLKYYYFKALSDTFDIGAVFRKPVSSLDGDMFWQGKTSRPPHVTVSAARNPDGSWGVAMLNYTAGPDTPPAINPEWNWPRRPGYQQQSFDVTVTVDELKNVPSMMFTVHRSHKDAHNLEDQPVQMKNGVMTIRVNPMELVALLGPSE